MPRLDANQQQLIEALAFCAEGGVSLDDAAALSGRPKQALLAALDDSALREAVDRRAVELKQSGLVTEALAAGLLPRVLGRLADLAADDDVGASTLIKVAELAHRVAGDGEKRAKAFQRLPEIVEVRYLHVYDGEACPELNPPGVQLVPIRIRGPRPTLPTPVDEGTSDA